MINARSFQGNLDLLSAVNLFQLIRLASLSGQLMVRCADNTTHFIFTEGKINYGFSRDSRRENGQVLLDSQLLSVDQLKACLFNRKTSEKKKRLGAIAAADDHLPQTHNIGILYRHTRDVLFETLTWTEGSFSFVSNSSLSDEGLVLKEGIDSLIMKGLIFLDDSSAASSRMTQ